MNSELNSSNSDSEYEVERIDGKRYHSGGVSMNWMQKNKMIAYCFWKGNAFNTVCCTFWHWFRFSPRTNKKDKHFYDNSLSINWCLISFLLFWAPLLDSVLYQVEKLLRRRQHMGANWEFVVRGTHQRIWSIEFIEQEYVEHRKDHEKAQSRRKSKYSLKTICIFGQKERLKSK